MPDASTNRRGILAMIACMAAFNVNDVFMKLAAADLAPSQILAIRNVVATTALLAVVVLLRRWRDLRSVTAPVVLLRGLAEAVTAFAFVSALAHMPIADITAILIGSPLIITALSGPLLGERVGWRRWTAVVVGFVGVLLVVKPGGAGFSVYTLIAVATAFMVAGRDLLTRTIDPAIPTEAITLAATVSVLLLAIVAGGIEAAGGASWQPVPMMTLAWLCGAGLFIIVGNFLVIFAFRDVDVSVVSPFRYSLMIWAALGGVVVFGEYPDRLSLVGTGLIVAAGLYALHRETVRAREARRG